MFTMLYMLFGWFTLLSFGSLLDENHAVTLAFTGLRLIYQSYLSGLFQMGNKNDTSWLKSCKVCPVRKPSHCKIISPRGSEGCVDLPRICQISPQIWLWDLEQIRGTCVVDLPLVPFSIYFHEIVVSVQLSYTDTRYGKMVSSSNRTKSKKQQQQLENCF